MICKYYENEFCVNNQCPMCADYCPVPEVDGVCKYEDRVEERRELSPKGCFVAALANHIRLDEDIIDFIWKDFVTLMEKFNYVASECSDA